MRLPIFKLRHVGVKYGWRKGPLRTRAPEFWSLKDLSLDLYHGETLGVIGSNGAGKSTLMRLLAGIIQPDRGKMEQDAGLHVQLLSVGVGFESSLTGRENAIMTGMLLGNTRRQMEAKLAQIIDFSELGQFINNPLHTYSDGMKARLGFAVALAANADVVLVDEILSVGDAAFQRKSFAATHELVQSDKTVVFISHDAESVRVLCDRALWIDKGRTMWEGPVEEVVEAYQQASLAGRGM